MPEFGTKALFMSLITFSIVTMMMLPFLSDYPPLGEDGLRTTRNGSIKLIALALLATFLFQAANMGIFAYAIGIGRNAMLEMGFISNALGVAAWIAIVGSVLVILLSTRFGRTVPVGIAIVLTAFSLWLLHFSDIKPGGWETSIYWWSNVLWGYLLGFRNLLPAWHVFRIRHDRADGCNGWIRVQDGPGVRSRQLLRWW